MPNILIKRYQSPCGELLLAAYKGRLCMCDWVVGGHADRHLQQLKRILAGEIEEDHAVATIAATEQLRKYFAGELTEFRVPMSPVGTEFQQRVWDCLKGIPYGSTVTYAEVAARVGEPKAIRAVANAIGANPISILIPCHRVIGSDGSLTGYAGGLEAKKFLIELEEKNLHR